MFLTKVLEKKGVVQFFGIALIISPIYSFIINANWLMEHKHKTWAQISLWNIYTSNSLAHKILIVANVVIGILLLKGAKNAWKYTLVLLVGYILVQFSTLNRDFKLDKFAIVYPVINTIVFAFIADQLAYKLEPKIKRSRIVQAQTRKKVMLHYDKHGPWAQVTQITGEGMLARRIAPPPPDIDTRTILFALKNGLRIQMRLQQQNGTDYFFAFPQLTKKDVALLNSWLKQISLPKNKIAS